MRTRKFPLIIPRTAMEICARAQARGFKVPK